MGIWEVTDDVLTGSYRRYNVSQFPVYDHTTHKALKSSPKEDPNPASCNVHASAFNKNKGLGTVSLDGYFHLWKGENTL